MIKLSHKISNHAFTIVELLIVIVVIGILSGIIFATYTGMNRKAITATVKSDLGNDAVMLKLYNADYGTYPTAFDGSNCPSAPTADTRYCLKYSSGNTIAYTGINQTFTLTLTNTNTGISYQVNELGDVTMVSSLLSPLTPAVTVALNGGNVQATITPISCPSGLPQYATKSRTNNGTWSSFDAWSTNLTTSQVANDDTKYGYIAQARCYTDASTYSSPIESTEGTYVKPLTAPTAPVVTSNTAAGTTTWSWPAVTCTIGNPSYQYDYTISPISFDSGWTNNNTTTNVAFTTVTGSQTYTVATQAKCTGTYATSPWSSSGSASYTIPGPPTNPVTAVTLNGANIQATITAVTCVTGTPQYGIRSRTNDGSWGGYSAWNTTMVFTQVASDGIKYGYQAQARCYVDVNTSSTTSTGTESTYIKSIAAPSAPTVTANTVTTTTTWSWNTPTCTSGTANYQYDYTISPSGYDSGWTSNGTTTNVAFTTATTGQTYTVTVQARCVGTYATSAWSGSGSAGYYRPIPTYTLTVISSGGGVVSSGGVYTVGSTPTITATPNYFYGFGSWTGSTGCSGVASHTITMDSDKSCTANFTVTPGWYVGIGGLAGKFVYGADTDTYYSWTNGSVSSFTVGCAAGGRWPTISEMISIYTDRASYGNNFRPNPYWTSTQVDGSTANTYDFYTQQVQTSYMGNGTYVRCVAG